MKKTKKVMTTPRMSLSPPASELNSTTRSVSNEVLNTKIYIVKSTMLWIGKEYTVLLIEIHNNRSGQNMIACF